MYIYLSESVKIYNTYERIILYYKRDNNTILYEENESGKEILLLCDGSRTYEEVIAYILKKNNLEDVMKDDIQRYINHHIKTEVIKMCEKRKHIKIKYYDYSDMIVPSLISIEITNNCNLRCNHCFNNSGQNGNRLSWESIKEIIDTASEVGMPLLYLTGGEPFTHPDIKKILTYIQGKFLNITIATNAYNIRNFIKDISELENCVLQISIDGLEEKHNHIRGKKDAFKNTVENIKSVVKAGIPVCVYFTLNENNYEDMENVVKLSKDLGCKAIKIAAVMKIGRAESNGLKYFEEIDYKKIIDNLAEKYSDEHFSVLNEKIEESVNCSNDCDNALNKCGGGYRTIYINAKGYVTICATMQNIVFGNINETSLKSILRNSKLKNSKKIPSPCKELCGDCKHLTKCNGCIARIFEHTSKECRLQNHEIFKKVYSK